MVAIKASETFTPPSTGGTIERLTTIRSLDLVLDGNEQIIVFDPAQTARANGLSVTAGGNLLFASDGYFKGELGLFINKSGGAAADISVWLEIKPLATGVFELASISMGNPIVFDDGGIALVLNGSLDVLTGDEVRIMIKLNSGTATIETKTEVMTLGTVNHFGSTLTVYRVGPISV